MSWDPFSNPLPKLTEGIGAKFDRLLSNIELTSLQKQTASSTHNGIRANLEKEFPNSRTFVVGSYGKNTSIRPPSDLDIMLVLPKSIYDKYNSFTYWGRNAQSEFLQEIKRRIQKYYPATNMKADGQVIIVNFSGSFFVEIVPCFEVGYFSQKYQTADTNGGGRWKECDPVGEANSLSASNKATNGNTVPLIKMLKCWKKQSGVELKSFHLEILAQNFLSTYQYKDKSSTYYDLMIRDFFQWLAKKHSSWGVSVYHPSTYETIDIGTDWKGKVDLAALRASKAVDFGFQGKAYDAKTEWQKIFGYDFVG